MRKPNRPPARNTAKPAVAVRTVPLAVTGLGAQGDGLASLDGQTVFIPFALPGERVEARIETRRGDGLAAALVEVSEPSADRIAPACPHFTRCGGCSLQHLDGAAYGDWKAGLLAQQLARHGLAEAPLAPLIQVAPGSRRRATFAFARVTAGTVLGFNGRASHVVIDLEECPLLDGRLMTVLGPLRTLLARLLPVAAKGDAVASLTSNGIDLLISAPLALDLAARETLAQFAESADLARLHWLNPADGAPEPIARRRPATQHFAGIAVEPPPGAFLQPSPEGEAAIARLVTAAVQGGAAGPVADLFAGSGSFSLPLARLGPVHAVEGEQAALAALDAAARLAKLPLSAECRDLARRPLATHELARFNTVVMDPPRAGAQAQVEELARPAPKGGPKRLVMVSCNPATLARDLAVLVQGGWRLGAVTPIDQFPWSAHLEAVAVLDRG
jgi:23S rRNA (uracil1939-C5)-methyltransferase